jgi:hypothetical protein
MEAQKEGLIALSAEVRENKTLFAKTINDYHDQIASIAKERNLLQKDVMNILSVPLNPRLKPQRGPSAYNLFAAEMSRGNGDLAAAAAAWKKLPEQSKKSYDPSVKPHESPRKKRCHKSSSQQMIEIIENFRCLVSYCITVYKVGLNLYIILGR